MDTLERLLILAAILCSLQMFLISARMFANSKQDMNNIASLLFPQQTTSVDVYPQITEPIEPYSQIPRSVKLNWTKGCRKACRWRMCSVDLKLFQKDEILRNGLEEWMRICNHLNITTIAAFGSLIAALYRNSTIMRWDGDIDMYIWAHDTALVEAFAEKYNKKQQNDTPQLMIQPYWRHKYQKEPPYGGRRSAYEHGVRKFLAPNLRLFLSKALFIDVWPIYADDFGPEEGVRHVDDAKTLQILKNSYDYARIPHNWIFPLQPCYLEGVPIQCPAQGSAVLKKIFGTAPIHPDHELDLQTGCWVPIEE